MKAALVSSSLLGVLLFAISACSTVDSSAVQGDGEQPRVGIARTLPPSREVQAGVTPQQVLEMLIDGNRKYMLGNRTVNNDPQRIREGAGGQHPLAIVLSCIDSRVPVEDVFDCGIGDLFVARVAGNIVNPDVLGSMEYACKVSGSKLIVVLGHDHCGAISAAIRGYELGNITQLLTKIEPAVEKVTRDFGSDAPTGTPEFVEAVCVGNVLQVIEKIRADSPILRDMEERGEIEIVGCIYHLENGSVELLGRK